MNTKTKTYVLNHENNGGGHKQITRRQILKIEHLARLMNDTAQNLASKIYDKSITLLNGKEAHEIILLLESNITKLHLDETAISSQKKHSNDS